MSERNVNESAKDDASPQRLEYNVFGNRWHADYYGNDQRAKLEVVADASSEPRKEYEDGNRKIVASDVNVND